MRNEHTVQESEEKRSEQSKKRTLPIVVQVAEFVGEALHLIRLQPTRVEDDVVRDRSHRALTDALRNQVEIIAEAVCSILS